MYRNLSLAFAIGLTNLCGPAFAQDANDTKVSSYAPVKVVEEQLDYYFKRIGRDLANEEDYTEDEQTRVSYDASTIAVLALSLGMHDEPTKLKSKASELIESAQELADSSDSFEDAQVALKQIEATLAAASSDDGGDVEWEPAAELGLLMQQVPIVNNALRRGVSSKRFKRSIDRTAGHAVTLAVLAQASMIDTSYCGDEEDEQEWQQICLDMREACAEVYRALRANDQARAKAGNAKIVKTCDDCHEKFRD